MNITVEKRPNDYMAYLNEDCRLWDCGRTRAEAIERVLITHGKDFDIIIIDKTKK